ncbi:hypothetical protein CWI37_0030p0060 [Hamiltosporidium tvaerminnensis]|uniref:Uncharacterized protein n=1 Tax=Hamiltosporidium tvaerminnensis TaxID=1176355 RepID=A0A4Q9LBP3_9MICR|nr:hypothetical protein CWI37_0030p0060 [Hamiltosporidium tvaerminnensis]
MSDTSNYVSFWRTKKFRIAAITVSGLIVMIFVILGIGYNKATSIIKDFEMDLKKVSESERFKKCVSQFKKTKTSAFGLEDESSCFVILPSFDISGIANILFDGFEEMKAGKVLGSTSLFVSETDLSKFPKVVGNVNFLTKIGFWFKGKHAIKAVYELSNYIYKELKNNKKNKSILVEIITEKESVLSSIEYDEKSKGSSKKILFEPLKIENDSFNVSEFIIFIAEKVRNSTD